MRKGTGLALLAIASIYQLNKMNKRKNEGKLIETEVEKELTPTSLIESERKSPVQIIKEQLKIKEELQNKKEVEDFIEVGPANLESAATTDTETDGQVEFEEEVKVKSFADVQAEVRAKIEQGSPNDIGGEDVHSFSNIEDALKFLNDDDKEESAEPAVVYIVGKGMKYHLTKDCRGVKKDAELTELTLDDAIDKGYSICGWESK